MIGYVGYSTNREQTLRYCQIVHPNPSEFAFVVFQRPQYTEKMFAILSEEGITQGGKADQGAVNATPLFS